MPAVPIRNLCIIGVVAFFVTALIFWYSLLRPNASDPLIQQANVACQRFLPELRHNALQLPGNGSKEIPGIFYSEVRNGCLFFLYQNYISDNAIGLQKYSLISLATDEVLEDLKVNKDDPNWLAKGKQFQAMIEKKYRWNQLEAIFNINPGGAPLHGQIVPTAPQAIQ